MSKQVITFGIVGFAAFSVHFLSVTFWVSMGMAPLIANILSFLWAFSVSFLGHNYFTFPNKKRKKRKASIKFLTVALIGFAFNEAIYWILLRFFNMQYQAALLIVLLFIPVLTFTLSKLWVFKHEDH